MNKKLFSIITIAYNDLDNLKLTIANVTSQEKNDFLYEYIVIDGASLDGSVNYLKDNSNKIDTIISEEDKGIYDAMNKGIEHANGKYLIFMNAGDTFASLSTLNEISNNINTNNFPDFLYGDSIEIAAQSDEETYKKSRNHSYIWYGLFIQHQSMIYSRDIVEKQKIRYRTEYVIASDYAFTYEVLSHSKNIKYIDIPICKFKLGGVSSTAYDIALEDQNKIRKYVMKYSIIKRSSISFLHSFMLFNQQYIPKLYNIIHFK